MIFVALAFVILCRTADMVTTWLASPDLKREINPIVSKLGWVNYIVANIILCPVASFIGGWFYWFLCIFSLLAAAWNGLVWLPRR